MNIVVDRGVMGAGSLRTFSRGAFVVFWFFFRKKGREVLRAIGFHLSFLEEYWAGVSLMLSGTEVSDF